MVEKTERFCYCCCQEKDTPRAQLNPLPVLDIKIGPFKEMTMPVIKNPPSDSSRGSPSIRELLSSGKAMMAPCGTVDKDGNYNFTSIDIVKRPQSADQVEF